MPFWGNLGRFALGYTAARLSQSVSQTTAGSLYMQGRNMWNAVSSVRESLVPERLTNSISNVGFGLSTFQPARLPQNLHPGGVTDIEEVDHKFTGAYNNLLKSLRQNNQAIAKSLSEHSRAIQILRSDVAGLKRQQDRFEMAFNRMRYEGMGQGGGQSLGSMGQMGAFGGMGGGIQYGQNHPWLHAAAAGYGLYRGGRAAAGGAARALGFRGAARAGAGFLGRLAGRAIPGIGLGLLAYDAFGIGRNMYHGQGFGQALANQFGFGGAYPGGVPSNAGGGWMGDAPGTIRGYGGGFQGGQLGNYGSSMGFQGSFSGHGGNSKDQEKEAIEGLKKMLPEVLKDKLEVERLEFVSKGSMKFKAAGQFVIRGSEVLISAGTVTIDTQNLKLSSGAIQQLYSKMNIGAAVDQKIKALESKIDNRLRNMGRQGAEQSFSQQREAESRRFSSAEGAQRQNLRSRPFSAIQEHVRPHDNRHSQAEQRYRDNFRSRPFSSVQEHTRPSSLRDRLAEVEQQYRDNFRSRPFSSVQETVRPYDSRMQDALSQERGFHGSGYGRQSSPGSGLSRNKVEEAIRRFGGPEKVMEAVRSMGWKQAVSLIFRGIGVTLDVVMVLQAIKIIEEILQAWVPEQYGGKEGPNYGKVPLPPQNLQEMFSPRMGSEHDLRRDLEQRLGIKHHNLHGRFANHLRNRGFSTGGSFGAERQPNKGSTQQITPPSVMQRLKNWWGGGSRNQTSSAQRHHNLHGRFANHLREYQNKISPEQSGMGPPDLYGSVAGGTQLGNYGASMVFGQPNTGRNVRPAPGSGYTTPGSTVNDIGYGGGIAGRIGTSGGFEPYGSGGGGYSGGGARSPQQGSNGAISGGDRTSGGTDLGSGGGAAYLAQRRQRFQQEINGDPELRRKLARLIQAENPRAGTAVMESMFNRLELMEQQTGQRTTISDYLNRSGRNQFYGPIRRGALPNINEQQYNRYSGNIDEALRGSNQIRGATDQGSGNDPNVRHQGGRVSIGGETFNDFGGVRGGHAASARFRENLMQGYNQAENQIAQQSGNQGRGQGGQQGAAATTGTSNASVIEAMRSGKPLTGAALQHATRMMGFQGGGRGAEMEQFLRGAGGTTRHAWCADFVRSWLKDNNVDIRGTNSTAASFRNWGQAADGTPRTGDVVYRPRQGGTGHVGVLVQSENGLDVLQGNNLNRYPYRPNQWTDVRRATPEMLPQSAPGNAPSLSQNLSQNQGSGQHNLNGNFANHLRNGRAPQQDGSSPHTDTGSSPTPATVTPQSNAGSIQPGQVGPALQRAMAGNRDAAKVYRDTQGTPDTKGHEAIHALSTPGNAGGGLWTANGYIPFVNPDNKLNLPRPDSLVKREAFGIRGQNLQFDTYMGQRSSASAQDLGGGLLDEVNAYTHDQHLQMDAGSKQVNAGGFLGNMAFTAEYMNRLSPAQRAQLRDQYGPQMNQVMTNAEQSLARSAPNQAEFQDQPFRQYLGNPKNLSGINDVIGRNVNLPDLSHPSGALQGDVSVQSMEGHDHTGHAHNRTGSSEGAQAQQVQSAGGSWGQRLHGDLMRDYGLSSHQAAGIVGNLHHESGGFRQMQEQGQRSGRGGLGIAQWTGPRRREFESLAAQRGLSTSSYEGNYAMLRHDLDGKYKNSIAAIRRTGDVQSSTSSFMNTFERPGVPHLDRRLSAAQRYAGGRGGQQVASAEPQPTARRGRRGEGGTPQQVQADHSARAAPHNAQAHGRAAAGQGQQRRQRPANQPQAANVRPRGQHAQNATPDRQRGQASRHITRRHMPAGASSGGQSPNQGHRPFTPGRGGGGQAAASGDGGDRDHIGCPVHSPENESNPIMSGWGDTHRGRQY